MLEDEDYQDAIHNMICNENVNAEYAVSITGDNFADMFANMDDPRVMNALRGIEEEAESIKLLGNY